MPGTVVDIGIMNKTYKKKNLCPHGANILMCSGQIRQKKKIMNHIRWSVIWRKIIGGGEGVDMWGFFETGEGCHLKWSLVQAGPARVGWASRVVVFCRAAPPESHVGRASRGQLAWYPWNSKEAAVAGAERVRQRVKRDGGRRVRMRCRSLRAGLGRLTQWRAKCVSFGPCGPYGSHSAPPCSL